MADVDFLGANIFITDTILQQNQKPTIPKKELSFDWSNCYLTSHTCPPRRMGPRSRYVSSMLAVVLEEHLAILLLNLELL